MPDNKIILLNFPPGLGSSYHNRGAVYPSTATMLLGTVLKNDGYDVRIVDGAYDEDYLTTLERHLAEDVLYVGMTVMTTQIPFALKASEIVKRSQRQVPVVWGGPHPTLFPEQTVRHPHVDIIAINEGTATARHLARCLQDHQELSSVKGIGYQDENGKVVITAPAEPDDIQQLPYFDFSMINLDNYLNPQSHSVYQREFPDFTEKVRMMPILTGLGCPYKCTFCINPILKRRYRFRGAKSIIAEIKRLKAEHQVNTFLFLDEDFFVNKNRVLELVSLAEQEELHFNWRMWCRVDHFRDDYVNKALVGRLGNIGYGSIAMGAESANQAMLDALKKDITPEQVMSSLKTLTGTRVFPRYSFMVGLEDETMAGIKNTYRMCLQMTGMNPTVDIAGPFVFRLYPGSPIYDRLVSKYHLHIPESLGAWVEHLRREESFVEVPWTPAAFRRRLKQLNFYSSAALGSRPARIRRPDQLLDRLWRQLARLRLRYFFLWFPF